jgi:hypothetical protein
MARNEANFNTISAGYFQPINDFVRLMGESGGLRGGRKSAAVSSVGRNSRLNLSLEGTSPPKKPFSSR